MRLASNHRWTWRTSARLVLERLPTTANRLHPVAAVRRLDDGAAAELLEDGEWVHDLTTEIESLRVLAAKAPAEPEVVYFSPEFAVSDLVPQYSGGLGVLAGDHLKAASDLGVPLAAVGLFYHHGFFRQSITDADQTEIYEVNDPDEFGCVDTGVVISVPMSHGDVLARVWRLDIGAVPLVLLDTDVPENSPEDVAICNRLYGSGRELRLRQELLLGIGGMRAVAALGWVPRVVHLNEGHAGFVVLPMLDEILDPAEPELVMASDAVRDRIVFTTHTPVPAGIELFDRDLIGPQLNWWAQKWGLPLDAVLELGADPNRGTEVFNMTALCLRHARSANGVSRLHAEVSRGLFGDIEGGDQIGAITNGVHARSWVHPFLQDLFDHELGEMWAEGDRAAWSRVESISGDDIARARVAGSGLLGRVLEDRTGFALNPEAMVVGFARRFAPYKRATLLLGHEERLLELLHNKQRPVQLIFAGKAHPDDHHGKALLAELVRFSRRPDVAGRLIFVPGYDMGVGRAMVAGCDIWLNTPVRPREASGTSGEKVALNGGLNCSILDGWWAEMFDGRNGWEIPSSASTDPGGRDFEDGAAALAVLEDIAAECFDTSSSRFADRIRYAWMDLGPQITAARMVRDYRDQMYGSALSRV